MRWVVALAAAVVIAVGVVSGVGAQPSLEAKARAELAAARKELDETKARVERERADLQARVAKLEAEIEALKSQVAATHKALSEASARWKELNARLLASQGQFKELGGLVRAMAGKMLGIARRSMVSIERPGRIERLKHWSSQKALPSLEELGALADMFLDEIRLSSQVVIHPGRFVDSSGEMVEGKILRVGAITAAWQRGSAVGYLLLSPETGRPVASGAELPWRVRRGLEQYFAGENKEVYVDISGGAGVRQLVWRMGLWEEILSGGPLVWPILLLGVVGLVLVGERVVFLRRVRANTDKLMDEVVELVSRGDYEGALEAASSQKGRPVGNVLVAGLGARGQPPEVVEATLSEAILKEMPRLERFLTTLKVFAAAAPLLGLLGTVTGMIDTFQVITVHGGGQPRLMAGGISEALVTTQLGLAVAIPLMVAGALLSRRVQRIAADMQEKAVALAAALLSRSGQR